MRAAKPRAGMVRKQMQALIRSLDGRILTFERARKTFGPLKQQQMTWDLVYKGEALLIPASGSVQTFGVGQVEDKNPRVIVAGRRGIAQGDFVVIDGRRYEVAFDALWFDAFQLLTLQQWEQGMTEAR